MGKLLAVALLPAGRYRPSFASDHLAEVPTLVVQWLGGVYEKFLD
jgi:hypothetical protein